MKIGVAVDSACDLPRSFMDEHRITVLPVTLRIGAHTLTDNRDPAVLQMFYREHYGRRSQDSETAPLSVEQIRDLFLGRLVLEYDQVFTLSIAATRSLIHANAEAAALAVRGACREVRQSAGLRGEFDLRVIDTQNLFAAQGVTAVEAVRLIKAGENASAILERLEFLAQNTYGYMLPRDLYFLRSRGRRKGDSSVNWLSAMIGTMLDSKPVLRAHQGKTRSVAWLHGFDEGVKALFKFLGERIKAGLLVPTLCISYGGELKELEALPGYGDLQRYCESHQVELFASVMSMTGAINVGEGALAVGFAAERHEFSV